MRRNITRRTFLAGVAAFAATPALAQAPAAREVEVAIVGAGAAGIAAARKVAAAGRTYALLEAAGRIGGRVRSGPGKFGVVHDQGAHRLYGGGRNPLVTLARAEGVQLYEPPGRRLYVNGREARDNEYDDFTDALRRASRAIVATGEAGRDLAAARVLPELAGWAPSVGFVLGPLFASKDLGEVSTVDFARAEERTEEIGCRDGLTAVLAAAAKPLQIQLEGPVRSIDTGARGTVALDTARGIVRARAAIVTVSTNVLAAGAIVFRPALPARLGDALSRLSLGTYDRIVFELAGNPFGLRSDERIVFKADSERTAALVGRVGGSDLAFLDVGGRFARDLARGGEAAMIGYLRELIGAQFGAAAPAKIGRTEVLRWSADPLVRGGFSAAAPGGAASRRVLMEPIQERLFLAGEAAHETQWGTVAGAWNSGERAADAALRYLAGVRTTPAPEEPPARPKRKAR